MTDLKKAANALAQATDSDVILINAGMDRTNETKFVDKCNKEARRTNAVVVIVTNGGDADAAYRIARCLQLRYRKITALITGQCKSAGTLLAIGAHELAFSPHGELGPLDVQLRKSDDMWAATSGLTVMNAFTALQSKSEEAFADFATNIKLRSGGSVTFKTAADIATKLTVGLFQHIYQQVEVMHLGEAARAMKIAEEYGQRLDQVADNLRSANSLATLVAGYPSHSFVIDMVEAMTIFKNVRNLSEQEQELCDALGRSAREQSTNLGTQLIFVSDPPPATPTQVEANDPEQTHRADAPRQESGAQGSAEQAAPPAQAEQPTAEVVRLATGTG